MSELISRYEALDTVRRHRLRTQLRDRAISQVDIEIATARNQIKALTARLDMLLESRNQFAQGQFSLSGFPRVEISV